MTPKEFNKKNLSQKADLVWEWGYYLTNCKYGNYNVVIFSFGDFFVELCMNIRENKTERVFAMTKDELHADYISAIRRNTPYMMPEIEIEEANLVTEAA